MGSKKPLNTGFVARRERGTDKYWVGSMYSNTNSFQVYSFLFQSQKKTTVGPLIARSLGPGGIAKP